ncbi:hypothetical protein WMF38_56960 [Sorangium sp. So ce118]
MPPTMSRAIEFLGTCSTAWLTAVCIRFAADFSGSPWWFAWVAGACIFGGATLLLVVAWAHIVAEGMRS